ncbi:AAA family ATPase [Pseudomonas sp.]|uniref:AAA family ATPase n=1 Tax=Pseudomonas sp. TaxID=306 RepID=UPI003C77892D
MKVLVLTGPESSGKSWLAEEIQSVFGGQLVGEYVRHFIEQEQRDTCYADISRIARGQLEWEDSARAARPDLLILDTHLLSNMLWSQALFGDCPTWIEQALLERDYHLHLLLDPLEVPWVDDGQRCQPELAQRISFYNQCKDWLIQHQQPLQCIQGDWTQRRTQTLESIRQWLHTP